jgi:predicted negative regulator of RcsB-dependent stress response
MIEGQRVTRGTHWSIWGALAVVFLCGLLVGLVAATAYHDYQRKQKWEQGLASMKPRVMNHLRHELRLSAEQARAIEPIVAQAEAELLHLRMAQQPRVEETLVRTKEALKARLSPEQQSQFDELYGKLERRWATDREYISQLPTSARP